MRGGEVVGTLGWEEDEDVGVLFLVQLDRSLEGADGSLDARIL